MPPRLPALLEPVELKAVRLAQLPPSLALRPRPSTSLSLPHPPPAPPLALLHLQAAQEVVATQVVKTTLLFLQALPLLQEQLVLAAATTEAQHPDLARQLLLLSPPLSQPSLW